MPKRVDEFCSSEFLTRIFEYYKLTSSNVESLSCNALRSAEGLLTREGPFAAVFHILYLWVVEKS